MIPDAHDLERVGAARFAHRLAKGLVHHGDLIVMTMGEPRGKSGGTNALKIVRVGDHR